MYLSTVLHPTTAEHTDLVDTHLGLSREAGVVPNSLGQLIHDCCCFGDSAFDLRIDGTQAGDGSPKVCKVLNNIQAESVDGNGWREFCALCHDVCLLWTDGQSKHLAGMEEVTDKLLQAVFCV